MDELDKIRQKKLEELKKQQQSQSNQQAQEQQQLQQQIAQLEAFVKKAMTKKALERYGNLKAAHQQKAVQLLMILSQLLQAQKLTKINDKQLKKLLKKMGPKKRGPNITRK